jgi:hypothetical protein
VSIYIKEMIFLSVQTYYRPLCDDADVILFVENILEITNPTEKNDAISKITDTERCIKGTDNPSTLNNKRIRHYEYADETMRVQLRRRIVDELIQSERLEDDEEITLGKGGAAPTTSIKREKKLICIIGPPASGKSGVAAQIADCMGAYILDSDYAKRKLPEYAIHTNGASLVHDESDRLVFSWEDNARHGKTTNLQRYCLEDNINMVVPKIGHEMDGVCEYARKIKAFGYSVYLISIDLDRKKATQRAYYRFRKTNRYVPLSLVFDAYANEPTLNYYRIRQRCPEVFTGYAQISTDVNEGDSNILVEVINFPEIAALFKEEYNDIC